MRDLDRMDAFDVPASVSNSPPPGPVAAAAIAVAAWLRWLR